MRRDFRAITQSNDMPAKRKFAQEVVDKAFEILFERLEERGVPEICGRLGVARNFFHQARGRNSLDFGAVAAALQAMEIEPLEYFQDLFPGKDLDGASATATRYRKRSRRKGSGDPGAALAMLLEESPTAKELAALIDEADELRYEDCEAAILKLYSRAGDIPYGLTARWLAVCGSALRMAGDLPDAELCLEAALKIAPTAAVEANAYQRFSPLKMNQGDLDGALEAAEIAGDIFLSVGSEEWYGKALVSQGVVLYSLGDEDEAGYRMAAALERISDRRGRLSAYEVLATIRHREGDHEGAWQLLRNALECAPSEKLKAGAHGVAAVLYERDGRFADAAHAYNAAFRLLEAPVDRLVCLTHLVHALARAGARRQAAEMGQAAKLLMGAVKGSKIAEAAVAALYRLEADTCVEAIEQVAGTLAGLRMQPGPALGDRVQRARVRAGLSRHSAADQMGIPEASLLRIESGEVPGHKHASVLETWIVNQSPAVRLALLASR